MGVAIPWLMRFGPLVAILLAAGVALALGVQDHLTIAELSERRQALQAAVAAHPILSLALFVAGFTLFVSLSLPGMSLGAALAGMMFGALQGGPAAIFGATLGASIVLVASRRAAGDLTDGWMGPVVRRVEAGLRDHGLLYLLSVRLVPIMPFWLVNLAAGCVRIPLRTYALGTALGIAPSLMLYAMLGEQIGQIVDKGGRADAAFFQRPAVYIPLICLCFLALGPIAIIRARKRRAASGPEA